MSSVNPTYNYYGYGPSSNMTDPDLQGSSSRYDWGVNIAISNGGNHAGLWRTLTSDEWAYLLESRTATTVCGTNNARYAKARVAGYNGLVLLPDSYSHPATVATLENINDNAADFNGNIYTDDEWGQMESAGAVFLPASGFRFYTSVFYLSSSGSYWSATSGGNNDAFCLNFLDTDVDPFTTTDRYYGYAVRLVCE